MRDCYPDECCADIRKAASVALVAKDLATMVLGTIHEHHTNTQNEVAMRHMAKLIQKTLKETPNET